MAITIPGRQVLQAAYGPWRTPAPAAQPSDRVDGVTHAAQPRAEHPRRAVGVGRRHSARQGSSIPTLYIREPRPADRANESKVLVTTSGDRDG